MKHSPFCFPINFSRPIYRKKMMTDNNIHFIKTQKAVIAIRIHIHTQFLDAVKVLNYMIKLIGYYLSLYCVAD